MLDFQFRESQYLYLLIVLLPLGWLFYWLIERRRTALISLMGDAAINRAKRLTFYYRFRASLALLAMVFIIIALARPQWGQSQKRIEVKGADVILAIDVSLSMLASDEPPSRLARARRLCIDLIEQLAGNRIGVIAFAGNNAALMPLTLDKGALEAFIDAIDVQIANNSTTAIEQAISQATKSLTLAGKSAKVLIIISDGEQQSDDPESTISQAAKEAANNAIFILSVGVGSTQGSKIPLDAIGKTGFKLDQENRPVITKLQENLLQIAASETGGNYLHVEANASEVKEITSFIEKLNKGEITSFVLQDREEKFQYFLAIAALLVLGDLFLLGYRT
ncbi:MAG: VWA domain-containing protein [Blastocatellia bacterium]